VAGYMTKQEKLLKKAINNPDNMSFSDFQTLMSRHGWILDHQSGSHQIWYSPESFRLSVQNRNGNAKGYQIKQFLTRLEEEKKHA
jgi:hypothetical protein